MTRIVTSAKGTKVDFDLLKIKQQINDQAPKSIDVVARERFIDKRRRRTSRKIDEMLSQQEESKRYAEDAIKLQQDQKKDNMIEAENVVMEAKELSPETDQSSDNKNEKFKRRINK